jgi:hypothetical protein
MRRLSYGQWIALLLLPAASVSADTPAEALARLQAVGREGAGNEAAARAWKDVVRQGPAALPAILQAMDDADVVAANWLRTAADAIVERARATVKPLPNEALEQFVRQTRHNGAARRLAYEWLCRDDPWMPNRLLPGMLQDPSPELRRDAVAHAIEQARTLLIKEKVSDDDRVRALRRALSGACDKDQVEWIVKELDKLGVKIDVAAHFGFVRHWLLIGPFDNRNDTGFNVAYPPEKGVDPKAVYQGRIYAMTDIGVACLDAATGQEIWHERLGNGFSASPIIADGKLYVAKEGGDTSVVQLGENPKILANNTLKEPLLATPAIANGAIYLRTEQHLYCIAAKK